MTLSVILVPWGPAHLPLLFEANTPTMTRHLGGPESEADVRRRHERYLAIRESVDSRMFAIHADGEPAGGIGYWPVEHDGELGYECGWNVVPRWQRHGVARRALHELIPLAAQQKPSRERLFAYPSVENAASNALCRSAGFVDLGERDFPFRGTVLRTRAWSLTLHPV